MRPRANGQFSTRALLSGLAVGFGLLLTSATAHAATGLQAVAQTVPDRVERFFMTTLAGGILLRVLLAIGILIVGWLIAKLVALGVYRYLLKATWDDKLAARLRLDVLIAREQKDSRAIERIISKTVYYLLLLIAIVAALQYSGLTEAAEPIQALVTTVFAALPRIALAIVILLVAYGVAYLVRLLLRGALGGLDTWYQEKAEAPTTTTRGPSPATPLETETTTPLKGAPGSETPAIKANPLSEGIAQVAFWLIMVFGLVAALDALAIDALSAPLSAAVGSLLAMLPALLKAALIVVVGYVLARIARTIITELARSVGVDRLPERVGAERVFERRSLSDVLGLVVFFFIMLQITIAALNTVGLETIAAPLTAMIARFWLILPDLGVAALLVVAGVIIGRLVRGVVESVLKSLGFDRLLEKLGFGELASKNEKLDEPSELVGLLVQVGVILLATAQAMEVLGLTTWAAYLNWFLGYMLQHVLVAAIVIVVGFAVGNYVRNAIVAGARHDGHDESRLWIASLARYAILVAAFTMAVIQLEVAQEFVLLAFGLLFGALCLALALAFGLGSRGVAEEIVSRQYKQAREKLAAESASAAGAQLGAGAAKPGALGQKSTAFKLGTPDKGETE